MRFTIVTSTSGLLCKRIAADGTKTPAANMSSGSYETKDVPFSDFSDILTSLTYSQALVGGVSNSSLTQISTKADPQPNTIQRTREFFEYDKSPLYVLDIDDLTYFESSKLSDILPKLYMACPALQSIEFWAIPSAGSCVHLPDDIPKITGWHLYFTASVNYKDLQDYLENRLWLAKLGRYQVSKTGSLLNRCAVDLAVFSPERLIFSAGSVCEAPYVQNRPAPRFIAAVSSDPPDWTMTEDERIAVVNIKALQKNQLKGACSDQRKLYAQGQAALGRDYFQVVRQLEASEEGVLLGSFHLHLDDGRIVPVWKVLVEPYLYDRMTLGDPLEPEYGACKSIIYNNVNNVRINSFAHGGRKFILRHDYEGLNAWLDSANCNLMLWDTFMATAELSGVEQAALLKKLKDQFNTSAISGGFGVGGCKVNDLKGMLEDKMEKILQEQLTEDIKEMNKNYAVVSNGSRVRIMREVIDPVTGFGDIQLYPKLDFLLLFENKTVKQGNKVKNLGQLWLSNKNRREYSGIVFSPVGKCSPEHYNLFKGWAFEPKLLESCPEECNHKTVCQAVHPELSGCGCNLYLQHIYEVICSKNIEYYKWVIDWCADMIQNVGNRPGTVLVMKGDQGLGKGIFADALGKLVGRHYIPVSSPDKLTGKFNSHLKYSLLVFADEAFWGGDNSAAGALKTIVTSDTINIEPKGVDTYTIMNNVRLIIASNNEWVVPVDIGERRFAVFNVSVCRFRDFEWFKNLMNQLENGGYEGLMATLQTIKITSNLRDIPRTEGLLDQIVLKMTPVQEFWYDLLVQNEDAIFGKALPIAEVFNMFNNFCDITKVKYRPTRSKFTRDLQEIAIGSITKTVKKIGATTKNVFIFTDVDRARKNFATKMRMAIDWDKR